MAREQHTAGLVARLLGVAAVLLAIGTPVAAQGEVTTEVVYTFDVRTGQVSVEQNFVVPANTSEFTAYIPTRAGDPDVSSPYETSLVDDRWSQLTITPSGQPAVALSYSFEVSDVNSEGGNRANKSFISIDMWPERATKVKVVLPSDHSTAEGRGLFEFQRLSADQIEYTALFPEDLEDYRFIAFEGNSYDIRTVNAAGESVKVAAWIGDTEWLDHTSDYVERGLPVLQQLIGQPWPEEDLEVVESIRPVQVGYGGWYVRSRSLIEVPDTLNTETLLHELAHAWFNNYYYTDRWMIEGLAEELASAALLELDGVVTEPPDPGPRPEGFDGLARWESKFSSGHSWEWEFYGYQASWFVTDTIADELGVDGMTQLFAEMQSGRMVYDDESDDISFQFNDWKRFLDVLEINMGYAGAPQLFREFVVPSDQLSLLEERATAREIYEQFRLQQTSESVPLGIRAAMSQWRFADAIDQMDEVSALRDQVVLLNERSVALGLTAPIVIDELFVRAGPDYSRVEDAIATTDEFLNSFEADGFSSDDGRNFELGRFDRIEQAQRAAAPLNDRVLNADQSNPAGTLLKWLLPLCGMVIVGLATVKLLARKTLVLAVLNKPEAPPAKGTKPVPLPPPPGAVVPPPPTGERIS